MSPVAAGAPARRRRTQRGGLRTDRPAAWSIPAAVHPRHMSPSCQCLTLRLVCRTVPIIDPIGFVLASVVLSSRGPRGAWAADGCWPAGDAKYSENGMSFAVTDSCSTARNIRPASNGEVGAACRPAEKLDGVDLMIVARSSLGSHALSGSGPA